MRSSPTSPRCTRSPGSPFYYSSPLTRSRTTKASFARWKWTARCRTSSRSTPSSCPARSRCCWSSRTWSRVCMCSGGSLAARWRTHRCLLGNPSPTLCERVRANQTAVEVTCVSYHSLTHRLAKTSTKEDPWEMIRCLVEEGLFYLYTFETEKANPFFLRAMECGCGGEVTRREPAALRAHGREGSSHQVPDLRHVAADRQRRQVSEERGCEE